VSHQLLSPNQCAYQWKKSTEQFLLVTVDSTYPKNISAIKKGEDKKVQITEWPKDVKSPWGQEEKLYQLGCVYRTPAYQVKSFKYLYISCKLSKDTISLANT